MDMKNMKKGICTLKLENLKKVYNSDGEVDDTLLNAVFSIIDFNVSGNHQLISKEVCLNSAYTLKLKPLLCKYNETTDYDNPNDSFGSHEEYQGKLRNGNDYIFTATHAIGVSEKEGYLGVVKDENGNDIDVLLASFMLWVYRYPNEVSLINEFYEKGEPLYTSCEYYYNPDSAIIKTDDNGNKYEEITDKVIFDGHCCLGENIEPAYNSSKLISFNTKWNKALNEKQNNGIQNQKLDSGVDINKNNNQKEDKGMAENKLFKALCELSHGDIREKIMTALSKTMTADEFNYVWVSNYGIYDNYFIYENYENDNYVNYKVSYTKTDTDVVVDLASKVQVKREDVWVEVGVMEASLNTLKGEITTKDETIKTLNSTITTLTTEKEGITTKFNDQTDTVVSLNNTIKEYKPIVDAYNQEQFEKSLNSATEFYKGKFEGVEAVEEFNKSETQELIKKSINSDEKISGKAKFDLSQLIVNNVKVVNSAKKIEDKSNSKLNLNSTIPAKENKDLVNTEDVFEQTYGFKKES